MAGAGDALYALDDRPTAAPVPEHQLQRVPVPVLGNLEPVYEALVDEDLGYADLHLRGRHGNPLVTDRDRVADTSQHVCNWISDDAHREAFLTPGSSPLDASSRTQIRHMPKSRR